MQLAAAARQVDRSILSIRHEDETCKRSAASKLWPKTGAENAEEEPIIALAKHGQVERGIGMAVIDFFVDRVWAIAAFAVALGLMLDLILFHKKLNATLLLPMAVGVMWLWGDSAQMVQKWKNEATIGTYVEATR
ncbi:MULTISPECIES: hypothetical protein [Pseudomonas]|uniref:hypothetical protein n=1 Tax=Pseudomonas TaxID=286 RepID=UPI001D48DD48|nr:MULTISPECIES: hypothetical protein [Pseudomonas]MBP2086419.1 hypothetical protein [Pseudomonas sp. PvP089]MBP2092594.1 hypothetical protein [Pseudomonas sp. PvP088]MBP2226588.1 hypothetical protein [Pseudomonas putida]